uniref:Uncharacterized protein n=1 Tax=Gopherus agassizii TaxID=38772 RepID=A0A452GYJ5_9SAUR
MAAENPMESLQKEATCPICVEYFTEPVSLECGHNFCRACISQCWEGSDTDMSCPQCRETVQQRNLRPNRQLVTFWIQISLINFILRFSPLHRRFWIYPFNTAHPQLVLSEDRRSLRWGETQQQLPNNPKRFDTDLCVLGCEGFTSGRHFWEVEMGDWGFWSVGVARESVQRKGRIFLCPEGGICAVERWWLGQFQVLTSPVTPLPLSRVPSRIRVCLDCDRGQVTFIGAGDEAPIFTFLPGSVPGGRIRPWLCVGYRSRLCLCP